MRIRLYYIFIFLLLTGELKAQREANIWYFGKFLGLDFNSGTAVPLNDGQLNTIEGVATISDTNGNLLFYTDGVKIWNRLHQVMPNGSGLFGHPSSTQSAVIVPKIGDPTRYYVFTVDQVSGPRGLTYSIVNMTLDGGKGDVELKNITLQLNVVEKITAVKHCNNRDIWVMAHGSASDIYYSFLVSSAGLNTTPVISHSGAVLPGVNPPAIQDSSSLGYLKASPNGKKIAAAHWTVGTEVSDFDNATGVVSNSINLFLPAEAYHLPYGVEFSPNSNLVYTTVFYTDPVNAVKRNVLLQYDVSLGSVAAIRASKQVISQTSDPIQVYAALQIAPDNKMYMAKNIYTHISAIDNPNVYGPGCNFVSNAVQFSLPTQQSTFGLPTFIQSYFYPVDSFTYTTGCDLNVAFNYTASPNVNSVQWNFGDPTTGLNNSSTQNSPTHLFSAAGTYNVELIKFTNCGPDTLRKQLTTNGIYVNLGADTLLCGTASFLLSASNSPLTNTYLWQDGSTNTTLTASTSGLYWVQVTNSLGCNRRDSINITFKPYPVFNLGVDRALCAGDTLTLNATVTGATNYLWNNGITTPTIPVFAPGTYWCQVDNGGCIFRDSLTVTAINPLPVINLGNDITVCEGVPVVLDATYLNSTYLWQNGSTNPILAINQPGTYYVQLDLNGCKKSDTLIVNHTLKPKFTLGLDQTICPGNKIILTPVLNPAWQWIWQDGSTAPSITILQPGSFSLSATNSCGTTSDQLTVSSGLCKVFVPTGFTPNNDGRNDLFKAFGTETVTEYDLKVFDRAGQVVFQTRDKNKGWDGKINGVPFPSAVFIYMLQYKDLNTAEPVLLKGTVALIK